MGAETSEIRQCWRSAIKELQRIPEASTPAGKLQQVGKAIEIVQHSFELFRRGQQINADDIVMILPYLLVKARVGRLLAQYNFIENFHYSGSEGDQIEVYKTNLKIAIQRIKEFS
jgi:hypothetical protein